MVKDRERAETETETATESTEAHVQPAYNTTTGATNPSPSGEREPPTTAGLASGGATGVNPPDLSSLTPHGILSTSALHGEYYENKKKTYQVGLPPTCLKRYLRKLLYHCSRPQLPRCVVGHLLYFRYFLTHLSHLYS